MSRIESIKTTSLKSPDIKYSIWNDISYSIRVSLLPKEHQKESAETPQKDDNHRGQSGNK